MSRVCEEVDDDVQSVCVVVREYVSAEEVQLCGWVNLA